MILSLALRYSFSPVSHHRRRSVRIMLTAALSMAIFITVISIIDYLQGERIGRIRDVRSFDIVIEGSFREDAEAMFPDADVFVYAEKEALLVELGGVKRAYEELKQTSSAASERLDAVLAELKALRG